MILNCATPFEDELLYSLLARTKWLYRVESHKRTASWLFAVSHALAIIDLPARLGALQRVGLGFGGGDPQHLMWNQTLLPFYAPFLPQERVVEIEHDLTKNGGRAVYCRAGIMASKTRPPSHLRFCPRCAQSERAVTGEAYWHRLHQIAGVEICPVHRVFLVNSSVRVQLRRTRQAFVPAEEVIPEVVPVPMDVSDANHQALLRISTGAAWLLSQSLSGHGLEDLRQRYLLHATEQGFATASGRIRWRRLLPEFMRRFPSSLLRQLQCEWPSGSSDHWLARMLRRPRVAQSPIRHLVLMDFLGINPESFFQRHTSAPLFGSGPWKCVNPVCPQNGHPAIDKMRMELASDRQNWVGIFTCPVCSQTRVRKPGMDQEKGRVRDYGHLWNAKLEGFWNDANISLRGVARALGVDSATVLHHAAERGLCFPRLGRRTSGKSGPQIFAKLKPDTNIEMAKRRAEWLTLREQHPAGTVKCLRITAPACYMYLYRHDRNWLLANSPPRSKPAALVPRVDWTIRDAQVAQRVEEAARDLHREAGRPRRISLAALGRKLGVLALIQKHSARLPGTRRLLDSQVESRLQYARRRVQWVAAQLKANEKPVKSWILVRKAGLRPDLASSPDIRRVIRAELGAKGK
jgi:hypothetical protein